MHIASKVMKLQTSQHRGAGEPRSNSTVSTSCSEVFPLTGILAASCPESWVVQEVRRLSTKVAQLELQGERGGHHFYCSHCRCDGKGSSTRQRFLRKNIVLNRQCLPHNEPWTSCLVYFLLQDFVQYYDSIMPMLKQFVMTATSKKVWKHPLYRKQNSVQDSARLFVWRLFVLMRYKKQIQHLPAISSDIGRRIACEESRSNACPCPMPRFWCIHSCCHPSDVDATSFTHSVCFLSGHHKIIVYAWPDQETFPEMIFFI